MHNREFPKATLSSERRTSGSWHQTSTEFLPAASHQHPQPSGGTGFRKVSQKLELASGSLCNVVSGGNKDSPLYIQYWEAHVICLHAESEGKGKWGRSVVPDSLRARGLQPTRRSCPLPSPRICSNSCPLSLWRHPTISSFVSPSNTFFKRNA